MVGRPRWFQWGYLTAQDGTPEAWYILIGLPSYVMQPVIYRDDGVPTMHQRHLLFKEPIPAGDGGWQEILWECS